MVIKNSRIFALFILLFSLTSCDRFNQTGTLIFEITLDPPLPNGEGPDGKANLLLFSAGPHSLMWMGKIEPQPYSTVKMLQYEAERKTQVAVQMNVLNYLQPGCHSVTIRTLWNKKTLDTRTFSDGLLASDPPQFCPSRPPAGIAYAVNIP